MVSLKLLFDKKSYSLTPLIMNNNNNEFIFLTNKPPLELFTTKLLKSSINLIYKKLFMDLINKLIPTKIQTVIKVFLIKIFPFNFVR